MSTVLQGTTYRLTFLTDRLVRLEYQPQGHFEDKPTTCARCRDFATVAIQQNRTAWGLEVDTEYLHLVYHEGPFTRSGLSITVKKGMTGNQNIWRYGDPQETLGGTAAPWTGPMAPFRGTRSHFPYGIFCAGRQPVHGAYRGRAFLPTGI